MLAIVNTEPDTNEKYFIIKDLPKSADIIMKVLEEVNANLPEDDLINNYSKYFSALEKLSEELNTKIAEIKKDK